MKYVNYNEPENFGSSLIQKITVEEAIKRQKSMAKIVDILYYNDDIALEHFMAIYYAWLTDEAV